jgi:RND family efflux transporter MFP subunit
MLRRLVVMPRRVLAALQFLLPACAGVVVAVLGALVQDVVVDRGGAVTSQTPAATTGPASEAAGAREVPVRDLLGVVVAADVVEIAARVDGRITEVAARLGDRVARGAVLARIDDRNLRDEQAAARAALHALVADRGKATSELEEARERRARSERLSHVLSEEELARVRYEEKYAASRLEATRARLEEQATRVVILERSLGEAQVRAPFDGLVAARYVAPGAIVSAGAPILRLVSAGKVLVRFAIPEALGARVRVGMAIAVEVEGATLRGTVDELSPEVDAASRMIVAEAHVEVPAGLADMALAGRAARVQVIAAGAEEPGR